MAHHLDCLNRLRILMLSFHGMKKDFTGSLLQIERFAMYGAANSSPSRRRRLFRVTAR